MLKIKRKRKPKLKNDEAPLVIDLTPFYESFDTSLAIIAFWAAMLGAGLAFGVLLGWLVISVATVCLECAVVMMIGGSW